MRNIRAQEHTAGRMLKGRQIYWVVLQSYKVMDVDDTMRDFELLLLIRMRDDDLQQTIVALDNLLL
eukprot:1512439-Pyramimonas_sp.AAC.1